MNSKEMLKSFGLSDRVLDLSEKYETELKSRFDEIDRIAEYNQLKIIKAMQDNRVSETHFAASTGYGYNDNGRDAIEAVYADGRHCRLLQ